MINACDCIRDKILLKILYETGIRREECANLKKQDFKLQYNEGKVEKGKGGH